MLKKEINLAQTKNLSVVLSKNFNKKCKHQGFYFHAKSFFYSRSIPMQRFKINKNL